MATTRITNVIREDLTEPDPDVRVTRVFVEVLHQTPVPPVPTASLVPVIITQNV